MLKEALQYLGQNSADTRKAGIRIVKTPGIVPGTIAIARADNEGVYKDDLLTYPLAPPVFQAKSIEGVSEFMVSVMPPDNNSKWHVFISDDMVNGFLKGEEEGSYLECPEIRLGLTKTEGWNFATSCQSLEPKDLIRTIRRLFTTLPIQSMDYPNIKELLTLLKRISVRITSQSDQSNGNANESIGLDVQKQLSLGGDQLPETVSVPVRMYKECMEVVVVNMNCWFDFDSKEVVLEPIDETVLTAELQTGDAIERRLDSDGIKPVIAHAKYLRPNLDAVGFNG